MTEQKFVVEWVDGFENNGRDDFNEIKRIRNRHESWNYVEEPLNETAVRTSGVERLQRLAGYLLKDKGIERYSADNVGVIISAKDVE